MWQVGDRLPEVVLTEFIDEGGEGCPVGPQAVGLVEAAAGKRVVIVGVPGAFTPTCSAKHLPGYVELASALRAAGVDEVWCVAVNDAFVMGAWGREQRVAGAVRMLADGSADFARAAGLTLDLAARGLGLRCQRFAAIVQDGVLLDLAVEPAGQLGVSTAASVLERVKALKA
ncbi:peroxiredoxin [Ideonella livida]|uniref:Glutathione-dependent peroxiredoxin n=1 Tax=Ideonella livida TaxID=2707176 RepID=A0A7C9PH02_9BURK|nr:peroxiredoxin [Ideonella livida]NDY91110.1 peroxiredoxin [Ideonella livida]